MGKIPLGFNSIFGIGHIEDTLFVHVSRTDLTSAQRRILAIDYGGRRVGIAISDPLNIIARSLGVFLNDAKLLPKIQEAIKEYDVHTIIVGMPYTLRGEKGKKAQEVEEFIEKLRETLSIEVVTWDERFTSSIAQQTMHMMGTTKKQRREKGRIDEMASALILQSYLDSRKKV